MSTTTTPTMTTTTALINAVLNNNTQECERLVALGANVNFVSKGKGDILLSIILSKPSYQFDINLLKMFVEAGCDIECTDYSGETPLMISVRTKKYDACEYLLQKGANINAQTNLGLSSLHYASQNGNYDMCVFLVENGANVLLEDNKKRTPLASCNTRSRINDYDRVSVYLAQCEQEIKIANQGFKRAHIETAEDSDEE